MNTEKIKDLCDLYGGDMDKWPKQERHDAVSWLSRATGPQIKDCEDYLAETRALDLAMMDVDADILTQMTHGTDIEQLENKIFAETIYQKQVEKPKNVAARVLGIVFASFGLRYRQSYLFAPVGSLAVMAMLGFMFGAGYFGLPTTSMADDTLLLDPVYYEVQAMVGNYE